MYGWLLGDHQRQPQRPETKRSANQAEKILGGEREESRKRREVHPLIKTGEMLDHADRKRARPMNELGRGGLS